MTAEVAILNKSAVALAADSAVTAYNGAKIYDSENKLFMLSKHHPVGIMVYNSGLFMGVPWETIIKSFRADLGSTSFPTLAEYVESFLQFLRSDTTLFTGEDQELFLDTAIDVFIRQQGIFIKEAVDAYLTRKNYENIETDEIRAVVSESVAERFEQLERFKNLSDSIDQKVDSLLSNHPDLFEKRLEALRNEYPFESETLETLRQMSARYLFKDTFQIFPSGLVFAGFGDSERFPSIQETHVELLFDNQLKSSEKLNFTVSQQANARIFPFAQTDVVNTLTRGISESVYGQIIDWLSTLLREKYPQSVANHMKEHLNDGSKIGDLTKGLESLARPIIEELTDELLNYTAQESWGPMLSAVSVLPKDELANMAETLVNLTSFKRRISMDKETVGGEVDVAVISRADGFVWIKRKHYFSPELNLNFLGRSLKHMLFDEDFSDCEEGVDIEGSET